MAMQKVEEDMAITISNEGGKNIPLLSVLLKSYLDICRSMFLFFNLPSR